MGVEFPLTRMGHAVKDRIRKMRRVYYSFAAILSAAMGVGVGLACLDPDGGEMGAGPSLIVAGVIPAGSFAIMVGFLNTMEGPARRGGARDPDDPQP